MLLTLMREKDCSSLKFYQGYDDSKDHWLNTWRIGYRFT